MKEQTHVIEWEGVVKKYRWSGLGETEERQNKKNISTLIEKKDGVIPYQYKWTTGLTPVTRFWNWKNSPNNWFKWYNSGSEMGT